MCGEVRRRFTTRYDDDSRRGATSGTVQCTFRRVVADRRTTRDLLHFFRRSVSPLAFCLKFVPLSLKGFLECCKTCSTVFLLFWWSSTISGTSPTSPPNRQNSFHHIPFFVGFELLSLPINKRHENAQTHWLTAHPSPLLLPHSTHHRAFFFLPPSFTFSLSLSSLSLF